MLAALAVVLIGGVVVYTQRRSLAARFLEQYLAGKDLSASVRIDALGLHRVAGQLRLRAGSELEATTRFDASITWRARLPSVTELQLEDPSVQLRIDSANSLQSLQRRLTAWTTRGSQAATPTRTGSVAAPRPSRYGTTAVPHLLIRHGSALIDLPQGRLDARIDGQWQSSSTWQLAGQLQPTHLRSALYQADVGASRFRVECVRDSCAVKSEAQLESASLSGRLSLSGQPASLQRLRLQISGDRLHWQAGDEVTGSLRLAATLQRAHWAQWQLGDLQLSASLPAARLDRSARALQAGPGSQLTLQAASVQGMVSTRGLAAMLSAGGTSLTAHGSASLSPQVVRVEAHLAAELHAVLRAAPVAPSRVGAQAAAFLNTLERTAHSMTLQAADVHLTKDAAGLTVALAAPMRLTSGQRASLTLSADPAAPLVHANPGADGAPVLSGALQLHVAGRGWPTLQARVLSYRFGRDRQGDPKADAHLRLAGRWSGGAVDALTLQASGRVRLHGGDYTVSLDHCAAIQGRGLSLSEIVLKDPHLELCASPAGPLYRAGPNGWSLHAGWQTLAASLPHWMLEARAGAGRIDLARAGQSLTGHVRLSAVDVRDQHAQPRFTPARLRGALSLSKRGWSGDLALSAAAQASLASVHLTAAPDLRSGRAQLAANAQFTSGGLQPSSLSPLLTALRRASGRVQLTALANWSNGQLGGAGQVQLQDFAFASPLGDVSGVNTLIALTSLWPLESAPNQLVQIGRVDALLPVTQLAAHFTLGSSDLQVEDAGMHFAGGTLTVGATRVPLRRQPTIAATVHLNDIDLNQLVAASTLSDRVTVDLHVSGTLPLTYGPTGLTVHEGSIFATGPGRLAIARSVWNAAPAGSAAAPATVAQTNTAKANVAQANVAQPQVAQAKPNAIQDFAYQALEHLAVDALDGRINSLPDGRLGILLHIRGRNDPASSAPTRIGIFELLRGRAFDKPVPLPSGTPIDATLDSSLNLEGLTGLTGNQREAH